LEVWLIGRDDNFVGQILMVLKNRKRKRKMFSKINVDEKECSKSTRGGMKN